METMTRMLISKKTRIGINISNYNSPSEQGNFSLDEKVNKENKEDEQDGCSFS